MKNKAIRYPLIVLAAELDSCSSQLRTLVRMALAGASGDTTTVSRQDKRLAGLRLYETVTTRCKEARAVNKVPPASNHAAVAPDPALVAEAERMGREARCYGEAQAPAQDPDFMDMLRHNPAGNAVGAGLPLLTAWNRGYQNARVPGDVA